MTNAEDAARMLIYAAEVLEIVGNPDNWKVATWLRQEAYLKTQPPDPRLAELIAAAEAARRRLRYIAVTSLPMTIEWREQAGETAEQLRAALAAYREVK